MSDEQITGAVPSASEDQQSPATETPESPAERTPAQREQTKERMNRALRSEGGLISGSKASTSAPDASPPTTVDEAKTEDEPLTLTKTELDRRIQAEVDRRENKRARDAETKAKRDQEVWLRDNDPQQFADLKRQEEEQNSTETKTLAERIELVQGTAASFDKLVLDPIIGALPKAEQDKIVKDHAHLEGFENRAAITKASLKALEAHFRDLGAKDAEEKLRKNPAFRKQIGAELRGDRQEPEIINGAPKGSAGTDMNAWIRGR